MSKADHIAMLQQQEELQAELERLERTPRSVKRDQLITQVESLLEEVQSSLSPHHCSSECGYCGNEEAGYDTESEDSTIQSVFNNFKNPIRMNKKVIAGVLIVVAVTITIVAIKMWRKAQPAA